VPSFITYGIIIIIRGTLGCFVMSCFVFSSRGGLPFRSDISRSHLLLETLLLIS
jgi:hypothetical protein